MLRKSLMAAVTLSIFAISGAASAQDFEPMGPGTGGKPGKAPVPRCVAKVKIKKEAPEEGVIYQEFDYEIRIKNVGTCRLNDLRLVDFLPESVEFKEASERPDHVRPAEDGEGERVVFRGIDLSPGEHFDVTLRVKPNEGGRITNRACVRLNDSRVCDEATTMIFIRSPMPPVPME